MKALMPPDADENAACGNLAPWSQSYPEFLSAAIRHPCAQGRQAPGEPLPFRQRHSI